MGPTSFQDSETARVARAEFLGTLAAMARPTRKTQKKSNSLGHGRTRRALPLSFADTRLLGDRVEAMRLELGLSQTELAQRAGIHLNAVSSMERGVKVSKFATVVQVADALDRTSLDYLAGRSNKPRVS